MTQQLKDGFELLDMLSNDGEIIGNLVKVEYKEKQLNYKKYPTKKFSAEEIIALENAAKFNVNYIYFRKFEGRASIPQIFIYDYVDKEYIEDEVGNMHKRLWSSVLVPMFFIFQKTQIKIFNCFEAPILKGENIKSNPLATIELAVRSEELIKQFSAKKIDNGSFWEDSKFAKKIKFSGSAYERLLTELKNTLRYIRKHNILEEKIAKKLLVKSILVKYLEERKDENGKTVFPKKGDYRQYTNGKRTKIEYKHDFFDQFAKGASSFVDILKTKGACVEFFQYLSKHFNGEIFKFEESELEYLGGKDLTDFAVRFFEKKLDGKKSQFVLWELYSFDDLPVELVSNVYEEFLDTKRGVVYTPPYLVNFLLEESMPLSDTKTDYKILDPSCGSGVFLVGAFKRLIYRWRAKNKWKKPDLTILKKLLNDNIFGVDKEPEAINLAIFSLSLALCDELSPLVIWDELRFDNLKNNNLIDKDFFEVVENNKLKRDFQLVIGNPPFSKKATEFTDAAKRVESQRKKERAVIVNGKAMKIGIPGNQIALLFLDQAINFCADDGELCLILPSSDFLYNNNSNKFRTWYLQNYHTFQILDFTNLSGSLFGNANVSVIALFSERHKPKNFDFISHITVRRNHITEEKLFFELDFYDFHSIPMDESVTKNFLWKSNLFGGGRLGRLLDRLYKLGEEETLGDFLKKKKKYSGWDYGEGFTIGNRENIKILEQIDNGETTEVEIDKDLLDKLRKNFKKADWLTNKKFIDADSFNNTTIENIRFDKVNELYFYRNCKSKKKIFKQPHILIKEVISNGIIPILFINEYLTFDDRLVGIHAPEEHREELLKLYKNLKDNPTYVFYTATTSPEFSISRATALQKKDIDLLPYPSDDLRKLRLSKIEKILRDDTLKYWLEYSSGKKRDILFFLNAEKEHLRKFGSTFCLILNSVYDNFKPLQPIETESFICFPFCLGEQPLIEIPQRDNLENHLNELLIKDRPESNLRIIRVLRLYERNVIYLIKPKQIKYWLRSVAIRDADEVFADLVEQEYQL